MDYLIFAVNPGSTSTKVALYENERLIFNENIEHDPYELEKYNGILNQYPYRKKVVLDCLNKHGYRPENLSCAVGRGGLFPPLKTGGYRVNDKMKKLILNEEIPEHASNIGALLADEIASMANAPAFIYDAVSANEFAPIAKITGMPEIVRKSFCHVLNSRAVSIKYAKSLGKRYEDMNLLVAHLGGGITFSVHEKGKIVDSLADDNGAFSPERTGSVPILDVISMCYSGKYTEKEMKKKIRGMGGLRALLGTSDCRLIEKMISEGDRKAELVYDAQAYQIAKGIGLLSPVLKGNCDAIILTGGLAHSKLLTSKVKEYVSFIAPVETIAGEFEMEALALGGLRILRGEEITHEFDLIK